jgi:hypothetical protein
MQELSTLMVGVFRLEIIQKFYSTGYICEINKLHGDTFNTVKHRLLKCAWKNSTNLLLFLD